MQKTGGFASARFWHTPAAVPAGGGQGLPALLLERSDGGEGAVEFGGDVVDVLEADGKADQFGEDAALAEVFVGELGVGGGGGDGEDVGEGAFGLRRRAVRDFARGGIDRELSGEKGPDPTGLDSSFVISR